MFCRRDKKSGPDDKRSLQETLTLRNLPSGWARIAAFIAATFSLFELYYNSLGIIGTMNFRVIHLMLVITLIFFWYPLAKNEKTLPAIPIYDLIFIVLGIITSVYLMVEFPKMVYRLSTPNNLDIFMGVIVIFLVLETTRRSMGNILPLIAVVFLLYCLFGQYIPGFLGHSGFPFGRIIGQLYTSFEGIYGTPIGVMVSIVYLFILFGAFLEASGAGQFFINLAMAIAGHLTGGPAKVAVLASAFCGMISGSGIANVAMTGVFTIPLMKKIGYKPYMAGAIEASASNGGQITPPVMGTVAFLICELVGVPYLKIVLISIMPCLMYYTYLYTHVHIAALKLGLKGLPKTDLPSATKLILQQGYYFLPVVVLIALFVMGYTVSMSAFVAIIATAIIIIAKERGKALSIIYDALQKGALNTIGISAACACAGLIVGTVTLTGLGGKFSSLLIMAAGNNLFLAILMTFLALFILGMGLPVVVAYLVAIIFMGPAMSRLGLPLLTAHMIVFWYSITANVTPPVCLGAYTGAGIAGANPNTTGWYAAKLSLALYIIPVIMAYTPLLLNGPFIEVVLTAITTVLGLVSLAFFIEGYATWKTTLFERILFGIAAFLLIYPYYHMGFIGFALLLVAYLSRFIYRRKSVAS